MNGAEAERSFDLFGSRVRILVGPSERAEAADPVMASIGVEGMLRRLHADLTRFDPGSALSALNDDPAWSVSVGAPVAAVVQGGIEAARTSGGLVDFTLLGSLESSGYIGSRVGVEPAPLAEALRSAPPRRPATAGRPAAWRSFGVDLSRNLVIRPPGVRIDGGGIAKGLAADLAAARLAGYSSYAVDCGGDLAIGGTAGSARRVELQNPLRPGDEVSFEVVRGGVATSGLSSRVWAGHQGYAHHLIDPGTGRPAWTGVVQATALAGSARHAEVLAKAALLAGPAAGRSVLRGGGGVLVLDSGAVEVVGPLPGLRRPDGPR